MKKLATYVLAAAMYAALATTAFAQARHDEKPHGTAKPAPSSTADTPATERTPGRHDDRPHGQKKSKDKSKKPEVKKDTEGK